MLTALYWIFAAAVLIGIGINLNSIDKPREPLTGGQVLVIVIIGAIQAFLLIYAATHIGYRP